MASSAPYRGMCGTHMGTWNGGTAGAGAASPTIGHLKLFVGVPPCVRPYGMLLEIFLSIPKGNNNF